MTIKIDSISDKKLDITILGQNVKMKMERMKINNKSLSFKYRNRIHIFAKKFAHLLFLEIEVFNEIIKISHGK